MKKYMRKIREKEVRQMRKERKRFIAERMQPMRPTVIRIRPLVGQYRSRMNTDSQFRREWRLKERRAILATKRKKVPEISLVDCLDKPELAENVLQHFGPYELYVMSRVSKQTRDTVADTFVQIAPLLLGRFIGASHNTHRTNTIGLITKYKATHVNNFPLNQFLLLFAALFDAFRGYIFFGSTDEPRWLDYCFVRNFPGPEFVPDVPLRNCRVYSSTNYKAVCEMATIRWGTTHDMGQKEMVRHLSRHFNYNEWMALNLEPVAHDKPLDPRQLFFFDNADRLRRVHQFGRGQRRIFIYAHPTDKKPRATPLFDLFEIRHHIKDSGHRKRVLPITVSTFRDDVSTVFSKICKLSPL